MALSSATGLSWGWPPLGRRSGVFAVGWGEGEGSGGCAALWASQELFAGSSRGYPVFLLGLPVATPSECRCPWWRGPNRAELGGSRASTTRVFITARHARLSAPTTIRPRLAEPSAVCLSDDRF